MPRYFRQCLYKDRPSHILFIDEPFLAAENEEQALQDLLKLFADKNDVFCYALLDEYIPQEENE